MEVLAATSDDSSRSKYQLVSSTSSKPLSFPGHDDNLPLALPDGSSEGALIYIHLDKHVGSLKTNAPNIGAALYSAGVTIGPEDLVAPGLKTPVSQGLHVYIARAKGVTLVVEDVAKKVYSRTENVDSLLREARVAPEPLDMVDPPPARELRNNMVVTVVRVREELVVEEERLEPATEYRSNPELEKGKQKLVQQGSQGHLKRWVRKRLENGREAGSAVEREELVQARNIVIEYGTKVTPVHIETPSGPLLAWRRVTLYATWYTAASSGKPRVHPAYGVTRSGLPAGRGVVAVDPSVIPLGTQLYIPGYGPAVAGDTGGGVRGLMVDLGYDEDEPHTWRSGWTEVYIVSPEPPASSSLWRLP